MNTRYKYGTAVASSKVMTEILKVMIDDNKVKLLLLEFRLMHSRKGK